MHCAAPAQHPVRPRAQHRPGPGSAWRRALLALACMVLLLAAAPVRADERAELTTFDVIRDEDGVYLNYAVDFELSRSVEDALAKAVPLFFVAEEQIYRDRWY